MKTSMLWTAAICGLAVSAAAHPGRRFQIQVVDGQLRAQGYITDGVDDGNGLMRPYYNSIHDHWTNVPGDTTAISIQPGYDLLDPGPLVGEDIMLRLIGASKWVAPPMMPMPGTIPLLEPLGPGETISVTFNQTSVNTDSPGLLPLLFETPVNGAIDMDPLYAIGQHPANVIYVLQFELSTTAPGVAASDPIHVLMSPDGDNMMMRLHHASLYLESYLGIPSPSALAMLGLAGLGACRRRR